jgi:hypothetical protein
MRQRIRSKSVVWRAAAAVACFISSALSLGIGFILTTGWILNADRHPVLHGVGITLLIIGIPLLILGGHCLDLMERKEISSQRLGSKQARVSRERLTGVRDSTRWQLR